jgi:hypothetical protein
VARVLWLQFVDGGAQDEPHRGLVLGPARGAITVADRKPSHRARAISVSATAAALAGLEGSATTQGDDVACQINNVGKGNAGNTPASWNEGVGEHVRTRFQMSPKAACGIAELLAESRTERRKLVSSAGSRKRSDPTVDLMSRRHPLSSTRTSRRR